MRSYTNQVVIVCSSLWPDKCSTCVSGYILLSNTDPCIPCFTNCATCSPANTSLCFSCLPGYWYSASTYSCGNSPCRANCNTCKNLSACSNCSVGYFLAPDGSCQPNVDTNCLTSSNGNKLNCTACSSGYVLSTVDGTCLPCSGSYVATCNMPLLDSNGKVIIGAQTTTLSCIPGSYLTPSCGAPIPGCLVPSSPNTCSVCSPGYYSLNNNSLICSPCLPNCQICTNDTSCSSCFQGYYINYVPSLNCFPCPIGCNSCQSSSVCFTCSPGYFLNGALCVSCTSLNFGTNCNCNIGSYWNGTNCTSCKTGCSNCTTSTYCTLCFPNYYMDGNTCKPSLDPNCGVVLTGNSTMLGICKTCNLQNYYDPISLACLSCSLICLIASYVIMQLHANYVLLAII